MPRKPKEEEIWDSIFPFKRGDWVEFIAQYQHRHRRMKGYIEGIRILDNGVSLFAIRVTWCQPVPRWGKPRTITVKDHKRLKRLTGKGYGNIYEEEKGN